MAYSTLQIGSSGDEVRKLQEKLGFTGEDLDGIYGQKTAQAVRDYQTANSLKVDGIAGNETLGHMYGAAQQNPSAGSAGTSPAGEVTVPAVAPSYQYNADTDSVYQAALDKLKEAKEGAPVYAGTYDEKLQAIYDKIMNREDFKFDLNGDAMWNQYKDQYVQQGRAAMMDTMGQAAALTGGYGSSYGQQVGQQTYQGHMQQLNEKVPELYQLARSMYDAEGDALKEEFALTGQLAGDEYAKFQDAQTRWLQNVDRAQTEADTAWERGRDAWYTERQLMAQDEDTAYARKQDAYDRLVSLMTSTGYSPSQEELTAAGMSPGEAVAYGKYYSDQLKASRSSGGTATPVVEGAKIDFKSIGVENDYELADQLTVYQQTNGNKKLAELLQYWAGMDYINDTALETLYVQYAKDEEENELPSWKYLKPTQEDLAARRSN